MKVGFNHHKKLQADIESSEIFFRLCTLFTLFLSDVFLIFIPDVFFLPSNSFFAVNPTPFLSSKDVGLHPVCILIFSSYEF